ncbi:MAG: hypothetical protein WCH60_01940 [Burkholderiales bacterium]
MAWLLGIRDAASIQTHAARGAVFETFVDRIGNVMVSGPVRSEVDDLADQIVARLKWRLPNGNDTISTLNGKDS